MATDMAFVHQQLTWMLFFYEIKWLICDSFNYILLFNIVSLLFELMVFLSDTFGINSWFTSPCSYLHNT